jgi:hypothetical protein
VTTERSIPIARQETSWPHRRVLTIGAALISFAGLAGTGQLFVAGGAPLKTELPLGLPNWLVSGLWLFFLVAVPAAVASWLCWRRSGYGPTAVLVASAGLFIDVVVQVPFVGFHVLQVVFGCIAIGMAMLALDARRRGWPYH